MPSWLMVNMQRTINFQALAELRRLDAEVADVTTGTQASPALRDALKNRGDNMQKGMGVRPQ